MPSKLWVCMRRSHMARPNDCRIADFQLNSAIRREEGQVLDGVWGKAGQEKNVGRCT